jgi:hypothetical protein
VLAVGYWRLKRVKSSGVLYSGILACMTMVMRWGGVT